MNEESSDDIPVRGILPRNLTARADYVVPGNPMIARPESGVSNAHPGLEVDVRALDRHFLPGLVFDFQFRAGAKLVDFDLTRLAGGHGLQPHDKNQELFLWAVRGRFGDDPDRVKTIKLIEVDGYMVLRRIMDLEPGPLAIIVGRVPRTSADRAKIDAVICALKQDQQIGLSERSEGSLVYARVQGSRAEFLTPDGVVDPELIKPGELTQTLCSPWQWDFADCHCYYWASSKPDIVISASGTEQVLNFQRDRRKPKPTRPASEPKAWQEGTITQQAMINEWETLPVVIAEQEASHAQRPRWQRYHGKPDREEIIRRLPMLAGREHALCVEYLFAGYSILAPRRPPASFRKVQLRHYRMARAIFEIAVEEMRHLRWINEALWLLGYVPTVERAEELQPQRQRCFRLRPLSRRVLDEFIDIEQPSSVLRTDLRQLDGMYTSMLVALNHFEREAGTNESADLYRRLKQLASVIIHEGNSHYDRFVRVRDLLEQCELHEPYLRLPEEPNIASSEPWRSIQDLCDAYYHILLGSLYVTFWLGRLSPNRWMRIARSAMDGLNDVAYYLAEERYAPLFGLPLWAPEPVREAELKPVRYAPTASRTLDDVMDYVIRVLNAVFEALALVDRIEAAAPWRLRRVAVAHRARLNEILARVMEYAGHRLKQKHLQRYP